MHLRFMPKALLFCAALAGCVQAGPRNITDTAAGDTGLRPSDAEPGACYGRETRPALIETVVRQFRPRGESGWRTETRQTILRERQEVRFRIPCPTEQTPDFIASVQRALAVRGLYRGPVTGRWDGPTRAAVRRYQQRELGLNSGTLSLEAGRRLGLIPVALDRAQAAE